MWLQQGDMQLLGEDNWGNPTRNRHFSLELEDMVGHGNPLVENTLQCLDPQRRKDLGQEEQNQDPLLSFQPAEMKQAHMKCASVEEELDQYMVDLMEGPSFFHPVCMEETGTQSQEVLYEGQSPHHCLIVFFHC
jgi:hypothetical protein